MTVTPGTEYAIVVASGGNSGLGGTGGRGGGGGANTGNGGGGGSGFLATSFVNAVQTLGIDES